MIYKKLKIDKNYIVFILIYLLILTPIVILRFPDIRNEIKYFLIVDGIIESKNFLILRYLDGLYPDKPPLYFIILYIIKKYFSKYFVQEVIIFGTLIPSFFIIIFFYKFLKKLKNKRMAFISAMFLLSLPFYIGLSVFLRMDMLMTTFIFFSLYFFFQIYFKKLELNKCNIFKIYIFIFLALFTKGIAGFVVPIAIIMVFLIFEKNLKFLKEIRFIQGVLLIIFLVGIWGILILEQSQGSEYLKLLFGQETIGRILNSKTHVRKFYYYIENIPFVMYPYGIAILVSIVFYIKRLKFYQNWSVLEKVGFIWSVVPLLLFSCASGKLDIYLLPIFPGNIILLINFLMRAKSIKLGKGVLYFTEILSVLAIPLNYLLNKKNNFYKRIILIPSSIFIMFILIIPGIEIYNRNFSLKYVIKNILKYDDEKIIAYRFSDMINLNNEINKKVILIENIESENLNDRSIRLIITRNKYVKDLKLENFKIVYQNRNYFLLYRY